MKFFHKSKKGLGLDIAGSSLKFLELQAIHNQTKIVGMSDVPLPKGLMVNDTITDPKTLVYLLNSAVQKPEYGRFSNLPVCVSLPESKSFVRVIQLPLMQESEIEIAVPVEAESFIPLPINQVYLDWQVLSTQDDKMEILIVASPRNFVDGYLNILDQAKLDVCAMEVESQSCHRALIPKKSQSTSLIVDIDSFRTSLIMVDNGNLQFTSSIPLAGNSFTDAIAKFLGVSGQKAELIKRTAGLANTSEYPNLRSSIDSLVKSLSAEIKNILKFHSEHSNHKVENLILAGGGAKAKNLAEILSNEFVADQIRVELGDPFVNLANLNSPPVAKFEALNFTTAIGLALRNLYENN